MQLTIVKSKERRTRKVLDGYEIFVPLDRCERLTLQTKFSEDACLVVKLDNATLEKLRKNHEA